MKIKKKNVKGMTLIEVIIALLIFTLLASIMVRVGSVTKSLMMNTNHMNNKVAVEAPVAAVQNTDDLTDAAANIQETDSNGDPVDNSALAAGQPVSITVKSQGYTYTANANKFSTAAMAREATQEGRNCDTSMQGDLEFYVIEEPTTQAANP